MSDLQIALLVIGIVIVAAVLVFNWVQERRFRKQAAAAFDESVGDALMQPGASAARMHPAASSPRCENRRSVMCMAWMSARARNRG
jgi:hypothetical protein